MRINQHFHYPSLCLMQVVHRGVMTAFFFSFCFYARARCLHFKADGSRLHSARLPMHLYLTVTVNNNNK